MFKTFEATIEADGAVHLDKPIRFSKACRAIVTIIEEPDSLETAILSENALAKDWSRPEEEEAWAHLQ